jgi:hypothetical protein
LEGASARWSGPCAASAAALHLSEPLRDRPTLAAKRPDPLAGHRGFVRYGRRVSSRHGRACPGHPRLACCSIKGRKEVDARHKAGHDESALGNKRLLALLPDRGQQRLSREPRPATRASVRGVGRIGARRRGHPTTSAVYARPRRHTGRTRPSRAVASAMISLRTLAQDGSPNKNAFDSITRHHASRNRFGKPGNCARSSSREIQLPDASLTCTPIANTPSALHPLNLACRPSRMRRMVWTERG